MIGWLFVIGSWLLVICFSLYLISESKRSLVFTFRLLVEPRHIPEPRFLVSKSNLIG